ncbi:hypothetical protein CEXT_213391 [Caerostris extrusa]|uniref:Uncharacterized protein n=1 Tax=Caerostris extrusa TaxID=172846 RepID=A0AAV4P5Q8_CAEEX|nr:hypothetical protein CEXT_213391 [Caerostris extrusa]
MHREQLTNSLKMNSVILSAFVAVLVIAGVQSQSQECEKKCRDDQYCQKLELGLVTVEYCRNYVKKSIKFQIQSPVYQVVSLRQSRICNDKLLKCAPGLECMAVKIGSRITILKRCRDPSSSSSTMMPTTPTTPTRSTSTPSTSTGTSTSSTTMSSMSTDAATLTTDMPTMTDQQ